MLLLTNGIARNSALSYEHVCNGRLSHRHRTFRDLSLYRSPRPVIASTSTLYVSLLLYLSISMSRETLIPELRWRFTMAEVMTVLSRWEFLVRADCLHGPSRSCRHGSAISFCGHSVVVDETFVLIPSFQLLLGDGLLKRMSRCRWLLPVAT